jgi:hypothetical protein
LSSFSCSSHLLLLPVLLIIIRLTQSWLEPDNLPAMVIVRSTVGQDISKPSTRLHETMIFT